MGQQCAVCQKKPIVGNSYTKRGKAKYLGGNGVKVTGKNKRVFNPNLQRYTNIWKTDSTSKQSLDEALSFLLSIA